MYGRDWFGNAFVVTCASNYQPLVSIGFVAKVIALEPPCHCCQVTTARLIKYCFDLNVYVHSKSHWFTFIVFTVKLYVILYYITFCLTHWGRVAHMYVSKVTNIGSDKGMSPGRREAIIWTNAGIFLIRTSGTNFSKILSKMYAFSFKKMYLQMALRNGGNFVSALMC